MPPIMIISVKKIRPSMMAPPASSVAKAGTEERRLAGSVLMSIVTLSRSKAAKSVAAEPLNTACRCPEGLGKNVATGVGAVVNALERKRCGDRIATVSDARTVRLRHDPPPGPQRVVSRGSGESGRAPPDEDWPRQGRPVRDKNPCNNACKDGYALGGLRAFIPDLPAGETA